MGASRSLSGSRGFTGHIGAGHTLGTSFGHSGSSFSSGRGLSSSNGFRGSTNRGTSNTGAFHGNNFRNVSMRNGSRNGFHNGFHDHGGFRDRDRFHDRFGCFGCGFGFGFGWGWGFGFGWGWGWGGWWGPWWWGPGWGFWGYPAYAYPYPIYPNYDVTYPPPYSGSDSDNNSSDNATPSDDYFQRPSFGGSLDAQVPEGSPNTNPDTGNVAATTPTVLVYLKDGTMYTASDYWLVDNKLHYLTSYSTESIVDMDEVDLQRTVDENAKRGVTFTLKPSRNGPAAAPDSAPAPKPNGNGTASSDPGTNHDGGATPAASPAPDPIPAPRVQDNSETQT